MKEIVTLLTLTCILSTKQAKAQTDPNLSALLAINETQFLGKPLDSIISVLPTGYSKMVIYGSHITARKITILYPNRVWIELHVREFSHMLPADTKKEWNLTLMRQEKLYKTVIYQHNNCYRNCDVR